VPADIRSGRIYLREGWPARIASNPPEMYLPVGVSLLASLAAALGHSHSWWERRDLRGNYAQAAFNGGRGRGRVIESDSFSARMGVNPWCRRTWDWSAEEYAVSGKQLDLSRAGNSGVFPGFSRHLHFLFIWRSGQLCPAAPIFFIYSFCR